jgi:creatinine amidohydrolase/Fe(II)-dependent formamide hydrolase-like protein
MAGRTQLESIVPVSVTRLLTVCAVLTLWAAALAPVAFGQVHHVQEMNTEQIRALDRQRTVVVLPGGILEQHGPYLPSLTDGYRNERLTQDLADAIVARPGWSVLVFPLIPLGVGGANEIGGKYSFSGTYAVRMATLRAVLMDLATELGDQGFKWIFVVHSHGSPNHQLALDQAGDYFHDTYGGRMVNLFGLIRPELLKVSQDLMSDEERKADETAIDHGAMRETSEVLFLHPELVNPGFRSATPYRTRDPKHAADVASGGNWPGYFGSPSAASAAYGAKYWQHFSSWSVNLALRILDGLDYSQIKRVEENPVSQAALEDERRRQQKQSEWLKAKGHER